MTDFVFVSNSNFILHCFVNFIDIKLGRVLIEGKTKIVFELTEAPGQVLLQSKDRITAGDGAKAHDLEGKAAISTATTSAIFELLNNAGESNKMSLW